MPSCHRCLCEFQTRRGQNKYCQPCSPLAYKERDKIKWLARTGNNPVGSEIACSGCGTTFIKPSVHRRFCEPCRINRAREKCKRYRLKNLKVLREKQTETDALRRSRPERQAKLRAYCRVYADRKRNDPSRRLNRRMSQMLRRGLIGGKQWRSWKSLVDFSLDDLRSHLERQFGRGMSWQNMGAWHIDHILPIASFGAVSVGTDEFRACWALTNLRPMWAAENLRKGAKRFNLI